MKKTLLTLTALLVCSAVAFAGDSTEVKQKMDTTEHKMEMKKDTTETKAPEIITTESGLQYIDHKIGDGAEAIKGSQIEVHYTGWVYVDGKKTGEPFDSSLKREPIAFRLGSGQMIRGWDEGLVGVKVGGKRTLIIPASLGWGARGAAGGAIPPNATVIFDCEMISVK